jgi:hypothetical protein
MSGTCKWCQATIFWKKTETGFIPYEDEAKTKTHDCPNRPSKPQETPKSEPQKEPPKSVKVTPLTDSEVLFVRKWKHFVEELQPK